MTDDSVKRLAERIFNEILQDGREEVSGTTAVAP